MVYLNWDKCNKAFYFLCVMATFSLIIYSIMYYTEENDVSVLEYKMYNSAPEYFYPSISLYFRMPFLDNKLREYGNNINSNTYAEYLLGEITNDKMSNISYDDVTVDVSKHLLSYDIIYTNFSRDILRTEKEIIDKGWKMPYVSYRSDKGKAYSVDIPFQKDTNIINLRLNFSREVFNGKNRPQKFIHLTNTSRIFDGFEVLFHLPGQFLLSDAKGLGKWNWPKLVKNVSSNIDMMFSLRNVDVLKLRKKRKNTCSENFIDYDQMIFHEIAKKSQCVPGYLKRKSIFGVCKSTRQLKYYLNISPDDIITRFDPPCRSISKVQFDYEEIEEDDNGEGIVQIGVNMMDRTFKQIEQTSAYNFENLVGDVGGYLGLFLGYAVAEVPSTIFVLVVSLKRWFTRCLKKKVLVSSKKHSSENGNISPSNQELCDKILENCMPHMRNIISQELHKLELQVRKQKKPE